MSATANIKTEKRRKDGKMKVERKNFGTQSCNAVKRKTAITVYK